MPEEKDKKAMDKAYEIVGHNAYFGNGFYAGIEYERNRVRSCEGCIHLYNNDRHCTLSHNHCIRKAEDYYEQLKEE